MLRSRRHGVLLALPMAAFVASFSIRAVRPVLDPTLIAISLAILVCVVGVAVGRRWAAVAFLVVPIALVASPAAQDLSFSLSSPDSDAWRIHAFVSLLLAGLSIAACTAMLLMARLEGAPDGRRVAAASGAGGLLLGVGLIGLVQLAAPVTIFGADLSDAERDALPKVALVNYAYAPLELEIAPTGVTRFLLVNPSDLPHTVTVETGGAIDVDVYVPAHREAVLEIDASSMPAAQVEFFCAIGDHLEQGMVGRLVLTDP